MLLHLSEKKLLENDRTTIYLGILSLCQQSIELGDKTLQHLIRRFISHLFTQLFDESPEKKMLIIIFVNVLFRRQAERFNTLVLFQIFDIECQFTISLRQHINQRMNHITPRLFPLGRMLGVIAD